MPSLHFNRQKFCSFRDYGAFGITARTFLKLPEYNLFNPFIGLYNNLTVFRNNTFGTRGWENTMSPPAESAVFTASSALESAAVGFAVGCDACVSLRAIGSFKRVNFQQIKL